MPAGTFGAAAGKICADNGGTALDGTNRSVTYKVLARDGLFRIYWSLDTTITGAGAINSQGIIPIKADIATAASFENIGFGQDTAGGGSDFFSVGVRFWESQQVFNFIPLAMGATNPIQNDVANLNMLYCIMTVRPTRS